MPVLGYRGGQPDLMMQRYPRAGAKNPVVRAGKLLLLHAQMDENVHYQHTAQLVDALVAAGKPFDLLVLPSERHGQRAPASRAYVSQRVATFFADNL